MLKAEDFLHPRAIMYEAEEIGEYCQNSLSVASMFVKRAILNECDESYDKVKTYVVRAGKLFSVDDFIVNQIAGFIRQGNWNEALANLQWLIEIVAQGLENTDEQLLSNDLSSFSFYEIEEDEE